MKQIDFNFYSDLRNKPISLNRTPKTVKASSVFKNLFGAGILGTEKVGRGTNIIIKKTEEYDSFLKTYFPSHENLCSSKANNIRQFKNSKARGTIELPMLFLRGFSTIEIDGKSIDIKEYTQLFGFFGLTTSNIKADKICFVENKNTFLNVEKLLGFDWIYVHTYGRVGLEVLKAIECKSVLVFVDYDFNGLDEYLRVKSHFNHAELFIPDNFDSLFETYGTQLKGKQKASKKVLGSTIDSVSRIRRLVETTNKFLEQEILIND